MTVSGLGSSHPQFPPVTPSPNKFPPVTPSPNAFPPGTPGPSTAAAERGRQEQPRNDLEQLTEADRTLIQEVTGQRIGPGFDPARESPSAFALGIAADRSAGRLAPGQEVTAVYLKDLSRRFDRAGGPNPIAPHLDKALAYLARTGRRSFDVSA